MSRFLSQTLIRTRQLSIRRISTSTRAEILSLESKIVEKIEDAIHGIIVKRSKPDWLPFVPGASYWVPPRRSSYGVAESVSRFANELNEEERLAVTSMQGWPSSEFYINNDTQSHMDEADTEALSTQTSSKEDDS